MKFRFNVYLLFTIIIWGCKKEPTGSSFPEISYEASFVYKDKLGKDSMLILSIGYKDDEGDLGLSSQDTLPPFNFGNSGFYNLNVSVEEQKSNIWMPIIIPATKDTLNFNQRFGRLLDGNKPKKIMGVIDMRIPAQPYPGIKPSLVKFKVYIYDRKMHKSNTITTNAIFLQH